MDSQDRLVAAGQLDDGRVVVAQPSLAEFIKNSKTADLYSATINWRAVLGISARAANCLVYAGIFNLADITQRTELELLARPNLGRKSVAEIKAGLANLGLALRPLTPPQRARAPANADAA